MSDIDLAEVYRTARTRLLQLAPSLDGEQLATRVPTCPAWTVQDVYAHLAGLAADVVEGEVERPGSDAATARQVKARRHRSLEQLTDEWRHHGPQIDEVLRTSGRRMPALAIDAWTHDQDVHNALGIVSGRKGPGLELTLSGIWRLKRLLRESGTAPLRVVPPHRDWVLGDTEPAATLTADDYEVARMFLGRRSLRQMRAQTWDGDPEPYLQLIPVFTPPAHDIIE